MSIPTLGYHEILKDFEQTIDWLNKLDVPTKNNRIDVYYRFMLDLAKNYKEYNLEQSKENFVKFTSYILDILNFNQIHNALNGFDKNELLYFSEILKNAVKGSSNQIDEGKNTKARDFLFEAMMAARFHSPENRINMIQNPVTDVAFEVLNYKLFVECKRISSENKLVVRINKAADQLNKAFSKENSSLVCGLIAINLSKLINPQEHLLLCQTPEDVKVLASQILQGFISEKMEDIQFDPIKNKKIMGIQFMFNCVSMLNNLPVHTTEWVLYPNPYCSQTGKSVLEHLDKNIKSSWVV